MITQPVRALGLALSREFDSPGRTWKEKDPKRLLALSSDLHSHSVTPKHEQANALKGHKELQKVARLCVDLCLNLQPDELLRGSAPHRGTGSFHSCSRLVNYLSPASLCIC